jgi:hypothetical protein
LKPLNIENKIDKHGFMLSCDTVYFNNWAKMLFFSLKNHCPWAHIHFHLFEPTEQDHAWISKQDCTYTSEKTPVEYINDTEKSILYWCTARHIRFTEIYTDSTVAIDLDCDSIMVKDLDYSTFMKDMERSWVPISPGRAQLSLCSALGFGADNTRHILRDRYLQVKDTADWFWTFDQILVDKMIEAGEIQTMDLKYTDYKFKDGTYIWTGKGERVYRSKFKEAMAKYHHLI